MGIERLHIILWTSKVRALQPYRVEPICGGCIWGIHTQHICSFPPSQWELLPPDGPFFPEGYCSWRERNTRGFSLRAVGVDICSGFCSHSVACTMLHAAHQQSTYRLKAVCQDADTVNFLFIWVLVSAVPLTVAHLLTKFPSHKNQQINRYFFTSWENKAVHAAEAETAKNIVLYAQSYSSRVKQPFTAWRRGMQWCSFCPGCVRNWGISSKRTGFLET